MGYLYEILEHPADIRLKVKATSLEEIFEGALKGMAEILALKENFLNEKIEKEIKVNSLDLNSLLVDFLSEVLTLTDINDSVFNEIEIVSLKENEIIAKIKGFKIKEFKEEIKAVTYHNLEIKKNEKNEYEVEVLFDI